MSVYPSSVIDVIDAQRLSLRQRLKPSYLERDNITVSLAPIAGHLFHYPRKQGCEEVNQNTEKMTGRRGGRGEKGEFFTGHLTRNVDQPP